MHQLKIIIQALGCPPIEELGFEPHEATRRILASASRTPRTSISNMLKGRASEVAIDLLSKMLVVCPRARITADEALRHPYLAELHLHMNDANARVKKSVRVFDNDFESNFLKSDMSAEEACSLLKEMMNEEITRLDRTT